MSNRIRPFVASPQCSTSLRSSHRVLCCWALLVALADALVFAAAQQTGPPRGNDPWPFVADIVRHPAFSWSAVILQFLLFVIGSQLGCLRPNDDNNLDRTMNKANRGKTGNDEHEGDDQGGADEKKKK
eukprot:Selendium_serpulae@DN787_c1_g1_i1.p2